MCTIMSCQYFVKCACSWRRPCLGLPGPCIIPSSHSRHLVGRRRNLVVLEAASPRDMLRITFL